MCLSSRNGHILVAVALLDFGSNLDGRSADGITPLYAAVEYNQEEMGGFLLEQKADVNAVDNQRNSVLHIAVGLFFLFSFLRLFLSVLFFSPTPKVSFSVCSYVRNLL